MRLISSILAKVGLGSPAWKGRRGLVAKFDAAGTGPSNRKHWLHADGLSANAALSPEVRRILRERARYEGANSPYCDGMLDTLARSVVGVGPLIQCWLDADEAAGATEDDNEKVENAFQAWAEEIDLAGKLLTASRAKVESGEVFIVLINNPKLESPVKLDLRLVEADQVASPSFNGSTQDVDGIEYDAAGNPTFYWILKDHPGSGVVTNLGEAKRESASNVIHLFRAKRPGQGRGYPEIAAGIPLLAYQRRFELATVQAAETAANFAAVIETNGPPDDEGDEVTPLSTIPLESGMATFLPFGYKVGQVKSEQPITSYVSYMGQLIRSFARTIGLPFNIAAGDSSGYNYASGRLDHQTFDETLRIERGAIERVVLRRVFKAWIAEGRLIRGYLPTTASRLATNLSLVSWLWPSREHVDPVKNATADAINLENGLTTRSAILAKQRIRFRDNAKKLADEEKYLAKLGLSADVKKPVVQPDPQEEQDQQPQANGSYANAA